MAIRQPPESLRRLVEHFNPDNYTFELRDGKRIAAGFDRTEMMARETQEDLQRITTTGQMVISLPFQGRRPPTTGPAGEGH
jgi:hypothetical protein